MMSAVVYAQAQWSRIATISSAFLIFETRMADEIYLTRYGLMAERHWREFRPKIVREMEAKGTLNGSALRGTGDHPRRNGHSPGSWKRSRR
jgi:hypothetical protein